MNRPPHHSDESWENDAVWKLLDQAPPATASPRFVDDVVRAARLAGQPAPWWKALVSPAPVSGLAAATAAVVFAVLSLSHTDPTPAPPPIAAANFAEIQEIAETEALLSAVDDLDKFSDVELVSLIGF